nr:tetratricopeptide repeat protein [Salinicola sp. S1-1-2]
MRTEEEQLDAIKQWWKDNGTALIVGILVAVAGVLGWQAWQRYQDGQAADASATYQQLMAVAGGENLDDNAREQALTLVDTLRDEHGGTLYADMAGLLEAKIAVEAGDNAQARDALNAVVSSSDRDYIRALARIDLARIEIADGEAQAALDTLDGEVPGALAAQRQSVIGDAYVALERPQDARDAYQQAQRLAQDADQTIYGLQLKLDDLGVEDAT